MSSPIGDNSNPTTAEDYLNESRPSALWSGHAPDSCGDRSHMREQSNGQSQGENQLILFSPFVPLLTPPISLPLPPLPRIVGTSNSRSDKCPPITSAWTA